jgi:hypothetical protein
VTTLLERFKYNPFISIVLRDQTIMPTTLYNVALPGPLQQENPPTVNQLISEIDPWVLYQLKSVISSGVHFENQLYGPLNTFISSIFLTRRRFMTIPQALLRKSLDEPQVDEDWANISFGSTGGLHESRDLREFSRPYARLLKSNVPFASGK